MADFRKVLHLLFILTAVSCSLAQDATPLSRQTDASPAKVALTEVSSVPIPSLPAESIGAPLFCDPDGRILFRLATPETGIEDPVSVSKDGKTVIRFGREKINDIDRPVFISMFLFRSDLYLLTRGSTPLGYQTKWRTATGEVQTQPASKSSRFVAHFDAKGAYAGSVPLDLPFQPMQLGVFENGDFLIAGQEPSTGIPRVAIVASNGQFRRFVELKGDVHPQENFDESGSSKDPTALPRFRGAQGPSGSLVEALSNSRIILDSSNLLLFRPTGGPIFSVSPSGEVQIHTLRVKGNSRLYTVKVTEHSWLVEFLHDLPTSAAQEFSTYAFDPESGAPLMEYFSPEDLGWGLACTDGNDFTFVMANDKTKTLRLVTLAPAKTGQ